MLGKRASSSWMVNTKLLETWDVETPHLLQQKLELNCAKGLICQQGTSQLVSATWPFWWLRQLRGLDCPYKINWSVILFNRWLFLLKKSISWQNSSFIQESHWYKSVSSGYCVCIIGQSQVPSVHRSNVWWLSLWSMNACMSELFSSLCPVCTCIWDTTANYCDRSSYVLWMHSFTVQKSRRCTVLISTPVADLHGTCALMWQKQNNIGMALFTWQSIVCVRICVYVCAFCMRSYVRFLCIPCKKITLCPNKPTPCLSQFSMYDNCHPQGCKVLCLLSHG